MYGCNCGIPLCKTTACQETFSHRIVNLQNSSEKDLKVQRFSKLKEKKMLDESLKQEYSGVVNTDTKGACYSVHIIWCPY